MGARPKIVLVGGDGGRSGVPTHIGHLCEVLGDTADLTVISDRDLGGYAFAGPFNHIEIDGLATSLNPFAALRAKTALAAALAAIKPDLVWAHARMALPMCRWAMRNAPFGRLVVTYHGLPYGKGHGALVSALSRAIDCASLRVADRHDVVFLTSEDRAAMARAVAAHRLHVLPNCSWLGGFVAPKESQAGARRLVMLTRASRQKNLDLAAQVFALLPQDFALALYGMGTESAALKDRFVAIMGPEAVQRVTFCGPTNDVRSALARAEGLMVTSRYEGLSIAMIEAMEMGLPVFSTAVGGTALIRSLHPMFAEITDPLDRAAAMIDQTVARYRQETTIWADRIHTIWAQTFAPQIWAKNVTALVGEILAVRA